MKQFIIDQETLNEICDAAYRQYANNAYLRFQEDPRPLNIAAKESWAKEILEELSKLAPLAVTSIEDLPEINESCQYVPADKVIAVNAKDGQIIGYFINN